MRYKTTILILFISIGIHAFDTLKVSGIGPGMVYYKITDKEKPLIIDLIEIDLTVKSNKIEMVIANDVLNKGGEKTSEMSARKMNEGLFVTAAINADFFGWQPPQAQNSMIIKSDYLKGVKLNRGMFAFTEDNSPHIGYFPFYGFLNLSDTLYLDGLNSQDTSFNAMLYSYWWSIPIKIRDGFTYLLLEKTDEEKVRANTFNEFNFTKRLEAKGDISLVENQFMLVVKDNYFLNYADYFSQPDRLNIFLGTKIRIENLNTMTGGLPILVSEGRKYETYIGREGLSSDKFAGLNPRTAIGYNKEKTKFYFITVDGRNPEHSIGISLTDLADFLLGIGCYDALNLDGGGSTTMTLRDSVVNKPSDISGERKVFNALLAVSYEQKNELIEKFDILENNILVKSEKEYELKINAVDKWGFRINLNLTDIDIKSPAIKFRVENNRIIIEGGRPGFIIFNAGIHYDKIWVEFLQ